MREQIVTFSGIVWRKITPRWVKGRRPASRYVPVREAV